jgi:hypothetical protein
VGRVRRFVDLQRVAEGESVAMKGGTTTSLILIDIGASRVYACYLQLGILTSESRAFLLSHTDVSFVLKLNSPFLNYPLTL